MNQAKAELRKMGGSAPAPADPALGMDAVLPDPAWKRALDLLLLAAVSPFLVPIFLVVSTWIKLTSRGPVFFRQIRVGAGGREFLFYKFRSMRTNVETQSHENYLEQLVKTNGSMTKLDVLGDPRLIPGGNFLRASGLDELPQLWNVLRGEMSLVGPRPCTSKEFPLYRDDQKKRFRVLPGLTGYWQVKGKNKTTFTEMIALDDYYVDHRSPGLDLIILVRTPMVLLFQVLASKFNRSQRGANSSGLGMAPALSNSKT